DHIDFHLAGQVLAAGLDHRHSERLDVMGTRLDILAGALGAEPEMNPLGPTRLTMAFVETFRDEQVPEILRVMLFEQYAAALEPILGDLYDAANAVLARGGYGLPDSAGPGRAAPSTAPAASEAAALSGLDGGVGTPGGTGSRYD